MRLSVRPSVWIECFRSVHSFFLRICFPFRFVLFLQFQSHQSVGSSPKWPAQACGRKLRPREWREFCSAGHLLPTLCHCVGSPGSTKLRGVVGARWRVFVGNKEWCPAMGHRLGSRVQGWTFHKCTSFTTPQTQSQ